MHIQYFYVCVLCVLLCEYVCMCVCVVCVCVCVCVCVRARAHGLFCFVTILSCNTLLKSNVTTRDHVSVVVDPRNVVHAM